VTLKSYFLDKTEVTLADYAKCEKAKACPKITLDMLKGANSGCGMTKSVARRLPEGAMSCVNHEEATAYCRWKGKRLPSDAEWEVAGRGGDTRMFPWGDEFPPDEESQRKLVCISYRPCAVREFGPYGPFNLYGMESGVREWTNTPACDSYPKDCTSSQYGLKGGAYEDYKPIAWSLVTVGGVEGIMRYTNVGFRCARDAE
jgi:iron(II)-dependent oxidoreductase